MKKTPVEEVRAENRGKLLGGLLGRLATYGEEPIEFEGRFYIMTPRTDCHGVVEGGKKVPILSPKVSLRGQFSIERGMPSKGTTYYLIKQGNSSTSFLANFNEGWTLRTKEFDKSSGYAFDFSLAIPLRDESYPVNSEARIYAPLSSFG